MNEILLATFSLLLMHSYVRVLDQHIVATSGTFRFSISSPMQDFRCMYPVGRMISVSRVIPRSNMKRFSTSALLKGIPKVYFFHEPLSFSIESYI